MTVAETELQVNNMRNENRAGFVEAKLGSIRINLGKMTINTNWL